MRRGTIWAGLLLVTAIAPARAEGELPIPVGEPGFAPTGIRNTFPPDIVPVIPDREPPILPPPRPGSELPTDRLSTPFATQTAGGGFQGRSFNEEFDGDFGAMFYRQTIVTGTTIQRQQIGTTTQQVQVGTRQVTIIDPQTGQPITITVPIFQTITVPVFGDVPVPVRQTLRVAVAGRYSGIMITDNDSPRPSDRLYFGYSYYDGLGTALNPGVGNITQNREMIGFEKTLFGGNASFGMRLPIVQIAGPGTFSANTIGDLSVLMKWAPIYNRETGDILSVGMVITTPTGAAGGTLSDGSSIPHSVLFQPWIGVVRTLGSLYFQGISNMILPTDPRDTFLLGHSLAMGYQLTRSRGLMPAITPTFEMHVRIPLNNTNPNGQVFFQDQLNFTGGVHARWNRLTFSAAACVPVIDPVPWNIEALANLNYRF